jgi:hypothetical protein
MRTPFEISVEVVWAPARSKQRPTELSSDKTVAHTVGVGQHLFLRVSPEIWKNLVALNQTQHGRFVCGNFISFRFR